MVGADMVAVEGTADMAVVVDMADMDVAMDMGMDAAMDMAMDVVMDMAMEAITDQAMDMATDTLGIQYLRAMATAMATITHTIRTAIIRTTPQDIRVIAT
jgi:hypothetical protein